MIFDDYWRLLVIIEEYWWLLMIIDDCWWLLSSKVQKSEAEIAYTVPLFPCYVFSGPLFRTTSASVDHSPQGQFDNIVTSSFHFRKILAAYVWICWFVSIFLCLSSPIPRRELESISINGAPESSISMTFSLVHHPSGSTTMALETPICFNKMGKPCHVYITCIVCVCVWEAEKIYGQ